MSETDKAQMMGEIIAACGDDKAADALAESVADSTHLASAVTDDIPFPFDDAADCWRFAIAFVASTLAIPITSLTAMTLAEFLSWHRQAVRLRIGQHQTAAAIIGAIASQATLSNALISN
ncbi:hypothetical protein [Bosea sp. (in: a-proteobacteria)]|uniref:hypothetical protein n=1 Tax=Bosea sp. (in: a-proteobacteria) TaxID=1871050 RepID=UPI002B49CCD4|nr:hypothetical protein [Bosea sp. (in: a-proteobacteria)]WRH59169.1 MAG: hypothetical protein RSE11_05110 [Bosea sp. (in: a-proteobacteria)]